MIVKTVRDGRHRQQRCKHEHRAGPEQEDGADNGEDAAQDLQAVTMQDNGGAEKNGQHEDAHLRVRV